MKTDQQLVNLVVAASRSRLIAEDVRTAAERLIDRYITACAISRGPNKERAEVWQRKAANRGDELELLYRKLTGKDYLDVREQISCSQERVA